MNNNLRLWYEKPAKDWNEALPLGNGRLGAMVFGGSPKNGLLHEKIQLNEDSVWSGGYTDRNNPDCYDNLEKIRRLIREGKITEAQQLAVYAMTGIPNTERNYQMLGDMELQHTGIQGEVTNYTRELDLTTAKVTVSFSANDILYKREVFISQPDNVLVLRLTANKPGALNFHLKLVRDRFSNKVWKDSDDRIAFDAWNGGEDGIHLCCMAQGTCDGTLRAIGEYLVIRDSSEAVIRLTAATSYRYEDPIEACRELLSQSTDKDYGALYKAHLAEYQPYFEASSMELCGDAEKEALPTDQRLELFNESQTDAGLHALYYHFGRYLLIACSRPGSLPANLQGIWCDQVKPPWDSKYTININTEMNYWPAENCSLSGCHQPLFDHLERMYPNGQVTAQKLYRARGWVAHHNTDIWGDTAPQDTYLPATYWVMGAAWLCTHIWEHYLYTLDKAFLKKYYYLMKDACLFFVDYLQEDEKGRMLVSPTVSPENTYLLPGSGERANFCEGCAMDSQILTELFRGTIAAGRILGDADSFRDQLTSILQKIPGPQIDSKGRIMEWLDEYEEGEPGHRHISHLYGLYPGHQMDVRHTPELAAAARKTLEYRLAHGGGHTGWSRAWIINFWAQLWDREKVQENLDLLLIRSTLPNLFDNHPPFQIDGNFGGIAGISRAVVQSAYDPEQEMGEVILLPALPQRWKEGALTGIGARGGLKLSVSWKNNTLEKAEITASHPYCGIVWLGDCSKKITMDAGETIILTENQF